MSHHDELQRDRAAIRSMAGQHAIHLRARETRALRADYATAAPYEASGPVRVVLAVDEPGQIELQELLVVGAQPLVLRRQAYRWSHEPEAAVRFLGARRFQRRPILPPAPDERVWVLEVLGADGSPMFASVGQWAHEGGQSTWRGRPTLAPPPQREAQRTDYDRRSITPTVTVNPEGWRIECEVTKLAGPASSALVKGRSSATFQARDDPALDQADRYRDASAGFWAVVRAQWDRLFADGQVVRLRERAGGEPRWRQIFVLAQRARRSDEAFTATEWVTRVAAWIERFSEK